MGDERKIEGEREVESDGKRKRSDKILFIILLADKLNPKPNKKVFFLDT